MTKVSEKDAQLILMGWGLAIALGVTVGYVIRKKNNEIRDLKSHVVQWDDTYKAIIKRDEEAEIKKRNEEIYYMNLNKEDRLFEGNQRRIQQLKNTGII